MEGMTSLRETSGTSLLRKRPGHVTGPGGDTNIWGAGRNEGDSSSHQRGRRSSQRTSSWKPEGKVGFRKGKQMVAPAREVRPAEEYAPW